MILLDWLPTVGNCCFCCSLKVGSIIIAVLGIIGAVEALAVFGKGDCFQGNIYQILKWVSLVFHIVMLVTAVLFIIGIILGWPITAEVFMYVMAISLILTLIFGICFFFIPVKKECGESWAFSVSHFLSCIVSFYFLVVVASYHKLM
ncbi:unnamed protein product [Chrysodeixis includens]|uniref:MARVEL domain-containing protein n=1 Tax=Chrysodeixis includens TaxID=689277 RepID=A0A9P0BPC6_CHRIL|nr:unnamed protein product [Chrysodeixis includens]